MKDACSVCGVTAEDMKPWGALVIHTQRVWKRDVSWITCLKCELKELRVK